MTKRKNGWALILITACAGWFSRCESTPPEYAYKADIAVALEMTGKQPATTPQG